MTEDRTSLDQTDEPAAIAECATGRTLSGRTLGGLAAAVMLLLVLLHLIGLLQPVEQAVLQRLPERPTEALLEIVNVFTCCILSWKALTVMLPAFLLGGAVTAFVPATVVLRYLGAGANRIVSYSVAPVAGFVLSLCSCNVVPLFMSIYRRGAGIGPAFAFLYAGPAINIVATVFTLEVIGVRMGIWRAAGVVVIGILAGLIMAFLFRREDRQRAQEQRPVQARMLLATERGTGRIWVLLLVLLGMVIFGALEIGWTLRLGGVGLLGVVAAAVTLRYYDSEERRAWAHETWGLVKLVVPVLVPALLIIGGFAAYVDIKLVSRLLVTPSGSEAFWDHLRPILLADVFGALMYFPILSEVAFAKAFLRLGMDIGPALAILLTGPGLSLPGLFIIARGIGWRKALAYQLIVIILTTTLAYVFASEIGEYMCECMMLGK